MAMISCQNVSKRYDTGHEALTDLNFEIEKGELVFLAGHSGAGKSTLLKLLAGIESASSGAVYVGGANLARLKKSEIPYYRRKMGIIFQNPMLLPDQTIYTNTALPLLLEGTTASDTKRRVEGALSKVGLLKYAHCYPGQLSVGQQQRVGIARAVVHRPQMVLADEPTGNLDPELALEIMQLFERFLQIGVTIFIASHDHRLIQSLPHRILTLEAGHLVSHTTPRALRTPLEESDYAAFLE